MKALFLHPYTSMCLYMAAIPCPPPPPSLSLQAIVKLNCNLVSVATLQDKVTTTVVN